MFERKNENKVKKQFENVGICIYFIGVSFQHGYELQKEVDEII